MSGPRADAGGPARVVGEGGADIAVGPDRVYRVMPEGAVAQWLPDTSTWEELDGLAGAITATDDR